MRTAREIEELLPRLSACCADDLEDQDLDFKRWDESSMRASIRMAVDMAVCMANGGGGSVVFGVADRVVGRSEAILGVPPEVDANRLKLAVYDGTDPRLTPEFEELRVPEGTGRLIVMQVQRGMPPYTDKAGRGTIRIGKDCKPLTGTLRRKILVQTGESDITAERIDAPIPELLSAAAMESLRGIAAHERAPTDLLRLGDHDLLEAVGALRNGCLNRAGVLLAGSAAAIREHIPRYVWTHLRMESGTEYSDREDGHDAIPVVLGRVLDRILADNPIQTVRQGLFHFEYRTYPEAALREALLNALSHADYSRAAPILIRQSADRIEISNPGGLVGGITPDNILHHIPVSRNPCLVDALVRLRLVNRSNLGIQRMYTSLLIEGKEPPVIEDLGEAFRLTLRASALSPAFRAFVAEEGRRGINLAVDDLLVLQHLLRHAEIEVPVAARLCQRSQAEIREILSRMERDRGYLDRGGSGKDAYWVLRSAVHARIAAPGDSGRDWRTDREAAKTRVASILRHRARRGEAGLSNRDIRAITLLGRNQVWRLMRELQEEVPEIVSEGFRSGTLYRWQELA